MHFTRLQPQCISNPARPTPTTVTPTAPHPRHTHATPMPRPHYTHPTPNPHPRHTDHMPHMHPTHPTRTPPNPHAGSFVQPLPAQDPREVRGTVSMTDRSGRPLSLPRSRQGMRHCLRQIGPADCLTSTISARPTRPTASFLRSPQGPWHCLCQIGPPDRLPSKIPAGFAALPLDRSVRRNGRDIAQAKGKAANSAKYRTGTNKKNQTLTQNGGRVTRCVLFLFILVFPVLYLAEIAARK